MPNYLYCAWPYELQTKPPGRNIALVFYIIFNLKMKQNYLKSMQCANSSEYGVEKPTEGFYKTK